MYSSAINVGVIKELDDSEELCDLAVRALDEIIDIQNIRKSGRDKHKSKKKFRCRLYWSAHYLQRTLMYGDKKALTLVHRLTEAFQYNLLKAQIC